VVRLGPETDPSEDSILLESPLGVIIYRNFPFYCIAKQQANRGGVRSLHTQKRSKPKGGG